MKRLIMLAACLVIFFPGLASAQGQTPQAQAQSRRGWYKVVGGSLSASIGLGVFAFGNTEDPFTGDKSTGKMALGLAMTGAGAWLMWDGWKDVQRASNPSIGFYVHRKRAGVVFRRSW